MLDKVPEIAIVFLIVNIIAATAGETAAGHLALHTGLGIAAVVGFPLAAAVFQRVCGNWHAPWIYWLTVVLVSIVGTQATAPLSDGFGGTLYASTAAFAVTLAGRHLRERIRGPSLVREEA